MAKLNSVKTIAQAPKLSELSDSFIKGNGSIKEYVTTLIYNIGDRIIRINSTTQQYETLRCITNGTTGAFNASKWTVSNLDSELTSLLTIQDEPRASLVRDQIHSGFISMSELTYGLLPNTFSFTNEQKVNVNGYIITIPKGTAVTLDGPPANGYREDLVFLEAWFEDIVMDNGGSTVKVTSLEDAIRKRVLKWRIRTVSGVDFETFKDGLANADTNKGTNSQLNKVQAQGANSSPLAFVPKWAIKDPWWEYSGFFPKSFRQTSYGVDGHKVALDDEGMYVAGNGTQESRDTLKTTDGYVYAIPLFRVKRRNSGGYRENNVNGAYNPFIATGLEDFTQGSGTSTISPGTIGTIMFNQSVEGAFIIGNVITRTSATVRSDWEVVAINGNKLTVKGLSGSNSTVIIGGVFKPHINRPDGKFSDIIDKEDVIDLRHKVALTGFDFNTLLEENFDKLLRGDLQTKDRPIMVKERFGLREAPIGIQSQLLPTRIKGNDGVERDLVNLLGGSSKEPTEYSVTINSSMTLDGIYNNEPNIKIVMTDGSGFKGIPLNVKEGKTYLAIAHLKTEGNTKVTLAIRRPNTSYVNFVSSQLVNAPSHVPIVKKFTAPANEIVGVGVYISAAGNSWITNLRLYEVDQATYDKIDVDPEFTGEKLAGKFPYVSSYPNVIENLFDKNAPDVEIGKRFSGVINGATSADPLYNMTGYIPVEENVTYYKRGNVSGSINSFYDGNKTWMSLISITGDVMKPIVVPPGAKYFRCTVDKNSMDTLQISKTRCDIYVPYGRWLLPYDYANRDTSTRLHDVQGDKKRKTWSDAQTSETVVDFIEAESSKHLPHISVTQATPGTWKAGDVIKVKPMSGVVTGLIDSDTAVTTTNQAESDVLKGATITITVNDVSKLSVGDDIAFYHLDGTNHTIANPRKITAVDTDKKTISFSNGDGWVLSSIVPYQIFESTVSSSSPVTKATGLTGVWSNLGTREATFTITTPPTTATDTIELNYSVNYPGGKGIKEVPSDVLKAKVNGLDYIKSDTLSMSTDFKGKVFKNTDAVLHNIGSIGSATLVIPSEIPETTTQADYNNISSEDDSLYTTTTSVSGQMAIQRFSINIVEEYERQCGPIPKPTLSDKIVWMRSNLSSYVFDWSGLGSSVDGNKATVSIHDGSPWKTAGTSSLSVVSKLSVWTNTLSPIQSRITSEGFVHVIAYADPSDGITPSTISTRYVSMRFALNVAQEGYDVFVPEYQEKLLVDSPQMFSEGENMLPSFNSGLWYLHPNAKVLDDYKLELNGTAEQMGSFVDLSVESGGVYYISNSGGTLPLVIYTLNDKGNADTQLVFSGQKNAKFAIPTGVTRIRAIVSNLNNIGGTTEIRNPMLTPGSSLRDFVPYNKDTKRRRILDLRNKITGDMVSNPHRGFSKSGATFDAPGTFLQENTQRAYDDVKLADGVLSETETNTVGEYAQRLYEFDFSHLGLSLKELKKAFREIKVKGTGNGSGNNSGVLGNGLDISILTKTGGWEINTVHSTATPTSFSLRTTSNERFTRDLKFYVLVASKYPASSSIASRIFLDHISLDIVLAEYVDQVHKNVVAVRPSTKELKLQYPRVNEITGREDTIELFYKTIPYQGLGTVVRSKILAVGKPIATTLGTGGIQFVANGIYKPFSNYSSRLPSPIEDYKLLGDYLTSMGEGSETTELTLIRRVNNAKPESRRSSLIEGLDFEPLSATFTSENVVRGILNRMAVSSESFTGTVGQLINQFSPIEKGGEALIALPFLIDVDGALMLVVLTFRKYANRNLSFYSSMGVHDVFNISGRPIIKGVQ